MAHVTGLPGEIDTEQATFSDVHLEAVHVLERHDPDPSDKDVPKINLPGLVNVYLVIDGGRVLLSQFPASRVLEAIAASKNTTEEPAKATAKRP